MTLSFYDIPFFLLFFLFTSFALFLLINRKGRRLSNVMLGSFFGLIGFNILDGYCLYREVYNQYPHFAFWFNGTPALYGPLLYLYVKSILYSDFRLERKHWWHALLFLSIFLLFIFIYHIHSVEHKLYFLDQSKAYTGPELIFGNIVLIVQIGLYLYFSFRAIKKYKEALEQRFSSFQQNQLSWLRFNLISYSFIYVITMIFSAIRFTLLEGTLNLWAIMIFTSFFLIFIMAVLYRALTHSNVFSDLKEGEIKVKKYAYSNLSDVEIQAHFQRLLQLMETDKPWLEPKLSIGDLAEKMNLPIKTLSQIINETTGQSFFDFINRRRIAAAQRLLLHPKDEKMTIIEIMYEVGFNSKSSFNTAFKKYTKLTPSQFKKQNTP